GSRAGGAPRDRRPRPRCRAFAALLDHAVARVGATLPCRRRARARRLRPRRRSAVSGLSSRDVAEIVGVPESRVRYWAQIGLVGPTYRDVENGVEAPRPSYAFTDLVAARAARELTERGIPARRVREAIATLRAQLPALDRPLLHLRVLSDGERLVVV